MTSKERGLKILKQFYDNAKSYYPFAVLYTFEELQRTMEARLGGKTFIAGLGDGAKFAEMDDTDTYEAMKALARQSGGRIPATNGQFTAFLVDQATQIKTWDAVEFTATESVKQVVEGAQAVGDTLISTGKILNLLFIPAVLYFGYLYLNRKVKA